ncbi:MAG: nicotinate-nucleotide adenylyltransferase [Prevotella sp.]|jgi:nicotinate-nucleotide adenylyltransferase|nr:nicotinate-nucleotide adenylyltransferase [Prevotella sp.]MCI1282154.1 nicotinate-nucleotide adenylyltransferase [Prevotella sp.]
MNKKIGLFGGSFNPIHKGHIAMAHEMLRKGHLDEIWFMVSPLNPFKKEATDLLDDDLRLEMTQKALEGEAHLKASDYEFHLPKPSYTWDTLQHLSTDFPQDEFTLLIGADNWSAWDRWYHAEDILSHYAVMVYPRKDHPIDAATLPKGVMLASMRLYEVSSSDIRKRVKEGQSVADLVPESILPLVEKYYGRK